MANCKECKMPFSKTSNLRAHVKRKHPEKLEILAPKVEYPHRTHACKECSATFVNLANLRVHIKRKHPEKLEELASIKQKVFMCKRCQTKFKMFKDLTLHKKTCSPAKEVKCPLCHFASSTSTMINHYKEMHDIQIDLEMLEFESFEAFKEWKIQVEKETFASFVNQHGIHQGRDYKRIKYVCHRSGDTRTRGKHIRTFKRQGSNKINAFCPAEMNVAIYNEKCVVKFCKSHVGHRQEQDLRHLFLSTSDRQHIAAKIASKVPFREILDDIRDSISNCHLERVHLLTRKDLYNIEQAFNLNATISRTRSTSSHQDRFLEEQQDLIQTLQDHQDRLLEEQQKLIRTLQGQILGTTSMEELEAVKKIVAPIKPMLETIRCNSKQINLTLLPSTSNTPCKKSFKCLFKTMIDRKKLKQTFSTPSADDH